MVNSYWRATLMLTCVIVLFSLSATVATASYAVLEMQQNVGGIGSDTGESVTRASDGGYYVVGTTSSFMNGKQVYLIRTDCDGYTLWQRNYGSSGDEEGNGFDRTNDGGFIIVGSTTSYGQGTQVYLLKVDSNGALKWQKNIGRSGEDVGTFVKQTSDGGYIITGYTTSYGNGIQVYLVKTDSSGNVKWSKAYGGSGSDYGTCVRQTSDGGYAIAGSKSKDIYFIKTNSRGDVSWQKTYGGSGTDRATFFQKVSGGYILTGETTSLGKGKQAFLLKIDSGGDKEFFTGYGGSGDEAGNWVLETSDGGYLLAGSSDSYGNAGQAFVVKTNSHGSQKWSGTYGGSGNEVANSVTSTIDGGYMLTGSTTSYPGNQQLYLAKVSFTDWEQTYGNSSYDCGNSVRTTSDGGYIAAGSTYTPGIGNRILLVKTGSGGSQSWKKAIGTSGSDFGNDVVQASDGGYLVVGSTSVSGNRQVYLVKTSSGGNVQWEKTYGGTGQDEGYAIAKTKDGGYIIAGRADYRSSVAQAYLIKTNSAGTVQWEQKYGGPGYEDARAVYQLSDGGYIFTGTTDSYGNGDQFYLVRTNSSGGMLWYKTYGGSGDDVCVSMMVAGDGGYVMAGTSDTIGDDNQALLIKTDSSGTEKWKHYYGGNGYDNVSCVIKAGDGIVFAGTADLYGDKQAWVADADTSGNMRWSRTFDKYGDASGTCIRASGDGYIIAGTASSNGKDMYLIKI